MSEPTIQPDDPRLTAYVLGELDESECAELERQLETNPLARAEVEVIRETAELLEGELANEPATALTVEQRAAIEAEAASGTPVVNNRSRWPQRLAIAVSGLATIAAAVIVLLVVPKNEVSDLVSLQSAGESDQLSLSYNLSDDVQYAHDPSHQEKLKRQLKESETFVSGLQEEHASGGSVRMSPEQRLKLARLAFENDIAELERESTVLQERLRPDTDVIFDVPTEPTSGSATSTLGRGTSASRPSMDPRALRQSESRIAGAPIFETTPHQSRPTITIHAGPKLPTELAGSRRSSRETLAPIQSKPVNATATATAPAQPSATESFQLVPSQDVAGNALLDRQSGIEVNANSGNAISKAQGSAFRDAMEVVGDWPKTGEIAGLQQPGKFSPDLDVAYRQGSFDVNTEQYHPIVENDFLSPRQAPLSTFAIDVDTGSYSNVRRFLNRGQPPPPNAVRIEELINYFSYEDPAPADGQPFSVRMETGPCPWNLEHRLLRVGLKGRAIPREERPPSNLVFLLDVSGSMRDGNKLPLVKLAMELLVSEMTEDDRIAIVTYAGNAGLALDSMSGAHRKEILSTIHNLQAGGSTNGEAGIRLAYDKAVEHFIEDGTNRVILCTDGDFNVGMSDDNALVAMIKQKARSGVFLSVFGFGMGNLKDGKLEQLADKGNGQYGYIDNFREARKVFFEELTGTLYTIAKDVKIQIEFNPTQVGAYRLVGYENRVMPAEDFHDDTKDAGEIGAGHSVTALYEVVPAGQVSPGVGKTGLKYQRVSGPEPAALEDVGSDEWLTLSLRYKQPDGDKSVLKEYPLKAAGSPSADGESPGRAQKSRDFYWTAAVAGFGMILRNSAHRGQADFDLVLELATASLGTDATGDRQEFIDLIRAAKRIGGR